MQVGESRFESYVDWRVIPTGSRRASVRALMSFSHGKSVPCRHFVSVCIQPISFHRSSGEETKAGARFSMKIPHAFPENASRSSISYRQIPHGDSLACVLSLYLPRGSNICGEGCAASFRMAKVLKANNFTDIYYVRLFGNN